MGRLWRRALAALGVSVVCAASAAAAPRTIRDCPGCPEMVTVPAGRFLMGADGGEAGRPEGPVRAREIRRAFAVGRTEVTNAQFGAFVDAAGYAAAGSCRTLVDGAFKPVESADWRHPGIGMTASPTLPAVCISWRDATAYAAWLSRSTGHVYRLPSEAEWEYVARAGGTGVFFWGNDEAQACAYGNLYDRAAADLKLKWEPLACDDGARFLAPVASYRPNAFGVYDTVGNAWEWTQDCYAAPYPETAVDGAPVEPAPGVACARRAVRGGGWMTRADRARSAFRGRDPEDARYSYFGFRVVRELDAVP